MKKLLILLLLTGCATKKHIEKTTEVKSDTLIIKTHEVVAPNVSETLTIEEPCKDSVLVKFKKVFVVKNDTITVETIDNKLRFSYQAAQSVIKRQDSVIKVKDRELISKSEKVKYRTPFWHWWAHLVGLLLIGGLGYWKFKKP